MLVFLFSVPQPCTEGEVILANYTSDDYQGISFTGGRVEVCVNGTFRPICDQGWDDQDADVVCNAMGYNRPIYRKLKFRKRKCVIIRGKK